MRRIMSKNKREKCKAGRCLGKRTFPEEKPRYCIKHIAKAGPLVYTEPVATATPRTYDIEPTTSLFHKVRRFVFVKKPHASTD